MYKSKMGANCSHFYLRIRDFMLNKKTPSQVSTKLVAIHTNRKLN